MKEWQTDARFDGQAAFDALRNGMQIRRVMWTAGCSVVAVDDDGEFTIIPNGPSERFKRDVNEFPNMLIEQLLEEGKQWEIIASKD